VVCAHPTHIVPKALYYPASLPVKYEMANGECRY